LEIYDKEIFVLSGLTISSHTLKHMAATVATYVVLRMILAPWSAPADRN
jgi:hypothetical protein